MKLKLLFLPVFIFLFTDNIVAQSCQDASVELSAVVQNSPARITLNWVVSATATQHRVYRKLKTATIWGPIVANLPGTATQYIDSTVSVGVSYEYKIMRTGPGYNGYGYINSGIEIAAMEERGILVLVVDSTFTTTLAPEIKRLQNDLEGDGWKIITHYVSPADAVTHVKALLVADYNLDPANTKAVFLLGNIPVPYSGEINPDGHPDHLGAWPADVYYADMDVTWSDVSANEVSGSDPRHHNIPGDGKFDESLIPSDLELQIGRVDFSNMPAFASTEQQLLKNYLDKDHDYRNKVFTATHRGVIDDHFGFFSGEAFAASAYKNFGPLVGPANVTAGDYFTTMTGNSYLWSYGCGGGSYTSAGGIGTTTDFTTSNTEGVFTMLFGSYFGDWDAQDNFLRAPLAQGKTLTNVWSGRPHWQFHHMGLGENIGYDVRASQNNSTLYYSSYGGQFIHLALMGDPTLRNDIIAPVSNVVATTSGTNCNITWTTSTDAVLGYYIYMKNDTMTNYVRLNQNIITGTSYTDPCLLYPGIYTYMVRAVLLQLSPSGTYYNLSTGIADTAMNTNHLAVHAVASTSIVNNQVTFTNTSTNATSYQWYFGDATTGATQNPVHIYPSPGNYTVMLIASNSCDADTILITVSIVLGIESATASNGILIYPNPSSGKLTVTSNATKNSIVELKIYNLAGELISTMKSVSALFDFDLSDQPNGIYFLSVESAEGITREKIIIQR
jgi:hypothetical protein